MKALGHEYQILLERTLSNPDPSCNYLTLSAMLRRFDFALFDTINEDVEVVCGYFFADVEGEFKGRQRTCLTS